MIDLNTYFALRCRRFWYVVVACASTCTLNAQADLYVYVDEQNVTHYSNVPHSDKYKPLGLAEVTQARRPYPRDLHRLASEVEPVVAAAAAQTQLDPRLLQAVIAIESGFDRLALSPRGAKGLMQLMPLIVSHYGVQDVYDAEQNVLGGAMYLADLKAKYPGELDLVLAAYNAGESAVDRYGPAVPPFAETQSYVQKVRGVYRRLLELNPLAAR